MISEIVHQVSIEVDEKGTAAKAATGISAKLRTLPNTFLIDRPFLFFVIDGQTDMVLLMGRVAEPSVK